MRYPRNYNEDGSSAYNPGTPTRRSRRNPNIEKIDDEILEDTFTCNILIDRIKNCDTIYSNGNKTKIIVRENDKKMMITNVEYHDNTLIIDIDDIKMKELDINDFLSQIKTYGCISYNGSIDFEYEPVSWSTIQSTLGTISSATSATLSRI